MSKKTKVWLIVAASLILVGCIIFGGIMTMLKWDFTKLSTSKFEANEYVIDENYENLSIATNTADVFLLPSENEKTSVVCVEETNMSHSVSVKDGTLVIEIVDSRKWYEHIGINFKASKITVYLPQGEYGVLAVKTSTGNIDVQNITAEKLSLSVSTGKVTVSDAVCAGDIDVCVSTGKSLLTNVRCKNFTSNGSTGNISLNNVIATEKLSIARSTGNVKLDGSDATEIFVKTDTGDITGSLLTEKRFIAHTDTGRIDVPKGESGGKCEVTTDTGNIKFS